jgi:hypothetical protein
MSAKIEIKNGKLIITADLNEGVPSASGKTLVLASSHGNIRTAELVNGKPLTVGFNAYVSAK